MDPGAVNPAVTQADLHQPICVRGYTRTIRSPVSYTEPLKREPLREYGYADQRIWHYTVYHLVPLAVGGAPRDPRNLWPEPRYGYWNAARKDRLENELHWLVCHGRAALLAAQAVFEHNWIAGYRRYRGAGSDSGAKSAGDECHQGSVRGPDRDAYPWLAHRARLPFPGSRRFFGPVREATTMSESGIFAGLVIVTILTVLAGIVTFWVLRGIPKQKDRDR
ncbi:MAG: hypothetical protein B7Z66_12155 [Chromatiales bacterium 21-64-14]|nr:MAG: hypothetical protein B7Z66_12155 [Chromatiales bacterium 21-64-14]